MEVARRKSAKDVIIEIKLVEEIKKNIGQPDFKALVLALYYYCWDNVKYGLLSKNLFQRKQQHGSWENFIVAINFYEKQ